MNQQSKNPSPKTIILGNGSSLLHNKNGHLIDTFDSVVRFNAYSINGYEDYVGTKTSIWFNVINFTDKEKEPRCNKAYDRIILHSWNFNKETDKLWKDFNNFCPTFNYEKTTKNILDEMIEYNGSKNEYTAYSTGAIALWMLLKEQPKLYISGFDWWNPSQKHHYNDSVPIGTLHKPLIEKRLIDKLYNEDKLIFL